MLILLISKEPGYFFEGSPIWSVQGGGGKQPSHGPANRAQQRPHSIIEFYVLVTNFATKLLTLVRPWAKYMKNVNAAAQE